LGSAKLLLKGDIVTHKLTHERVIIVRRLFLDPMGMDMYYRIRRLDFSIEDAVEEELTDTREQEASHA